MSRNRNHKIRRGSVTVEFAMTASLLFVMFMAAIEFTRFMFVRHTVDQAAYEACRFAIVPGHTSQQSLAVANDFMNRAGLSNRSVSISPPTITSSTRQVTVTVNANFANNSWITPLFAKNVTLSAQTTLDHENLAVLTQN